MKLFVIVTCLAICILAAYGFETEKNELSHSWSLADPALAILALAAFLMIAVGHWKFDRTATFQLAALVVQGLSALVNQTLTEGATLNFGRTAAGGLVLYLVMYNTVTSLRELRRFSIVTVFTALTVYAVSLPTLVETWAGGFTNDLFAFGFTGLNALGMTFTLLFCTAGPVWVTDRKVVRGMSIAAITALGAFISFSRSAVTNLFIASGIMMAVRDVGRRRLARVLILLAGLAIAGAAVGYLSGSLSGSREFGQAKLDDYGNDALNLRVLDLTVEPVIQWAREPMSTILIGDSLSLQHTFIANALWMFGLSGLICGVGIYATMILVAIRGIRISAPGVRPIGGCFLALVVVMFLDDCATNQRFVAQIVSYLFYTSAGAFAGSLRFVTRERLAFDGHLVLREGVLREGVALPPAPLSPAAS